MHGIVEARKRKRAMVRSSHCSTAHQIVARRRHQRWWHKLRGTIGCSYHCFLFCWFVRGHRPYWKATNYHISQRTNSNEISGGSTPVVNCCGVFRSNLHCISGCGTARLQSVTQIRQAEHAVFFDRVHLGGTRSQC